MADIQDSEFDEIFSRYGTILIPTKASSRDGILTGQREIRIDLTREIERKIEVIFGTTKDGKNYAIETNDNNLKYTCPDLIRFELKELCFAITLTKDTGAQNALV